MERSTYPYLAKWLVQSPRKPLVIRGARQVGKSYLVQDFCRKQGLACLEINFERRPLLKQIFASRDLSKIRVQLESHFEQKLQNQCLLFLDEIQGAPEVFALLRYFFEEWPELPVIAAGSLLDFALKEMSYSVPVGRIEYLFLGPMSFEEFLVAQGKNSLVSFLRDYSFPDQVPDYFHTTLLEELRVYSFIGGMPEAVAAFAQNQDFLRCDQVQKSLLLTYREDFNKYRNRIPLERLHLLFDAIPREVGKKLVYSRLSDRERSEALGNALDLLCMANICHKVHHSSGNGIPLGAEVDPRRFKVLFIDVGLLSSSLGIRLGELMQTLDLLRIHEGSIAEQLIGQQLLYLNPSYMRPELYYWVREKAGSMAEVDYLIAHGSQVAPVEVKAGKSGKLKSLRIFMEAKKSHLGIHFSAEQPGLEQFNKEQVSGKPGPKDPGDQQVNKKTLLHLPLYLVGQTYRILDSV